jgi:hypothetical protein
VLGAYSQNERGIHLFSTKEMLLHTLKEGSVTNKTMVILKKWVVSKDKKIAL